MTTATSGMAVPASDSEPHEVQRPATSVPTREADEQEGQGQVSVFMEIVSVVFKSGRGCRDR